MSKNEQKNRRRNLVEYISLKAELPSDALAGEVRKELRGRNTLFLGGCRNIVKYSPELVVLGIKGGEVAILGERLICMSYYEGTVSIEGLIESVRFLEEKK